MVVKYLRWLGIIACIALIVSCFLPWGFYADINQEFTGFYSYQNQYGKPGKLILFMTVIILACMFVPKVWAKWVSLFFAGFMLAYGVKSYILFTSCYNNYCPEKRFGIFLMLGCIVVILIASIFPKTKL